MVPSHRPVGFADGAALFPVYGLDFSKSPLGATFGRQERIVAAGVKPAAKGMSVKKHAPYPRRPRSDYIPR